MKGKEYIIYFGTGVYRNSGPNIIRIKTGIYPVVGFKSIDGIDYPLISVSSYKNPIHVPKNFLYGDQVPILLDILQKLKP